MKTINRITLILAMLSTMFAVGCKQEYMEYDASMAALRFEYPATGDSITYSFRLHPSVKEDMIAIPVNLMGYTVSHDRKISLSVLPASTAQQGRDYEIGKAVLKADSTKAVVKVTVKRSDALDKQDLDIRLRLQPNEEFTDGPANLSDYHIVLTTKLVKPKAWPFGDYSVTKHEFVISVTGSGDYTDWNGQKLTYWSGVLNKALYEYNKAHPGQPLKDENGVLVTF